MPVWAVSMFALGAVPVAIFLALPPAAVAATFPVIGGGDIHFRLDQASFRSGVGTTETEFYIEIDNDELVFRPDGDRFQAKVALKFIFYGHGRTLGEKTYDPEFWEHEEANTTSAAHTQVLQVRVPLPAESDSVHAWVEDRNSRKRGLVHMFTRTRKTGEAGAKLEVRRFPEGELSVSDVEFARNVAQFQHEEEATFFKHSGLEVEPNPGRVYGSLNSRAMIYVEIYDLAAKDDARRYELDYRIRGVDGAEIRAWKHTLRSQSSTWVDTTSFNVGEMSAGTYSLGLVVREEGGEGRAAVEAPFDVVWAASNWVRWLMKTEALVAFLPLGDADRFTSLGPGAKERYLKAFWAAHDPTPGPGNATKEEFDRRVEYSNANFSTPLEPGMRTDRGRVYIKYGEPDEIRREVIPVQGNDLNQALRELDRGTGAELRGNRTIDPEDARAFEVWLYDYRGDELFPSSQMSVGLGRQFVFVDDLGIGEFRLIRSTEKSEF